jgi:hypothetical protein
MESPGLSRCGRSIRKVGAGHLLKAQRGALGVERLLDLQVLVEVQRQRRHRLVGGEIDASLGAQLVDVGSSSTSIS